MPRASNRRTILSAQRIAAAFSLIEVVLAVAVFATAIVAVIGLMGPMTQRVEDVIDSETAARLAESIQTELTRIGFAQAVTLSSNPIQLVANASGDRVRLLVSNPLPPDIPADNPLNDATLPGIARRDRYFLITLVRQSAFSNATSGSLALQAELTWPFQIPVGPASLTTSATTDPFETAPVNTRRGLVYFFALTP